jgi:hypothetical protein
MATYDGETPAHIRGSLRKIEADIEAAILNVLTQQRRIERLQAAGYSTRLAERLLAGFRDVLTLRMASRDRIKDAAAVSDRSPRRDAR